MDSLTSVFGDREIPWEKMLEHGIYLQSAIIGLRVSFLSLIFREPNGAFSFFHFLPYLILEFKLLLFFPYSDKESFANSGFLVRFSWFSPIFFLSVLGFRYDCLATEKSVRKDMEIWNPSSIRYCRITSFLFLSMTFQEIFFLSSFLPYLISEFELPTFFL